MSLVPHIDHSLDFFQVFESKTLEINIALFGYIAGTVVSLARMNKATMLYTMPISMIGNAAGAVLGVVIGVIKLLVAPFFLIMSLVSYSNPQNAEYWKKIGAFNIIGAGIGFASPFIAAVNLGAPQFTICVLERFMKSELNQ